MRDPVFFHVDLDAFFAAVERLDNPDLEGKPIIVGATPGHRGVVATCSYEARAFGIHSAMPINEAFRRCPGAVFITPHMERYVEASRDVMAVFGQFTPEVMRVSIDEAFLGMTGTERLWGPPERSAMDLKQRVHDETGLTISVGVAANRYIAKIASGMSKPDGLTIVKPGDEDDFMAKVPLAKLWGAGGKTQERFRELGITSIVELRELGQQGVRSIFGKSGGDFLWKAAHGVDPGIYAREVEARSMSTETTFEHDVSDDETLEAVLLGMAGELMYRAYRENVRSRTVVLKLRTQDFVTTTKRMSSSSYLLGTDDLYPSALKLLRSSRKSGAIRLIGLSLANLESGDAPLQADLFDDGREKKTRLERAVFEIQERGLGTIRRARLIDSTPKPRSGLKKPKPGKEKDPPPDDFDHGQDDGI